MLARSNLSDEGIDQFLLDMELQARPFNVETVYANAKKKQTKRLRGPDSPLYTIIWPMVYVVRMFGFAPYNFSQDRLVPSNICLIFSFIAVILYSYILYVVFERFMSVEREGSIILGGTESTKVIINYSVVIYELGLAIFTRRSFVKIWNSLQDYDEGVRQLGYPRKETQTAIVAWILTVVTTIIWTIVNRSGMYALLEPWSYNIGYMLPYIGTLMALYKFAAMAFFLGQRFQHLNMIAMKNMPSTSLGKSTTIISSKTILSLHNDLMIAAEDLESLYSFSLLLWLGNLSLHIVSNIYFIIKQILMTSWEMIYWPLIFCLSIWLLGFLFQLLFLHIACDFASSQANSMPSILIQWQVNLLGKNKESVESLLQFLNRKLKFSAGGCFYINLPLLRSIAALMTTYLVILLQLPE